MNIRLALASLLLATAPAWAVEDIAPQEVGENPGVSGNISASYSTKSGSTEKDESDFGGKIQYDDNLNSLVFFQGTYERTTSSDVKTEDELLTHARYLHKLNAETLYGEVFLQDYKNTFKGIDNRVLLGGNLRWRFSNMPRYGKLYVGGGAFQEQLNYTEEFPEEDTSMTRANTYLAYTHALTEATDLNVIGYYQPAFENFNDYYTSLTAELKVHVVSGMHLSLAYSVDSDSRPPEDIPKTDKEVSTSLIWEF